MLYVVLCLYCVLIFFTYHVSGWVYFYYYFFSVHGLNFLTLGKSWLCWVPVAAPVIYYPWLCGWLSCLWLHSAHQSLSCWSSCGLLDFWYHCDCLWQHLALSRLNCLVVNLDCSMQNGHYYDNLSNYYIFIFIISYLITSFWIPIFFSLPQCKLLNCWSIFTEVPGALPWRSLGQSVNFALVVINITSLYLSLWWLKIEPWLSVLVNSWFHLISYGATHMVIHLN